MNKNAKEENIKNETQDDTLENQAIPEAEVLEEDNADSPELSNEESLQKQLDEANERILRMGAEFENTKKRIQKRSEELVKYANENLLQEILPVVDNLNLAIQSVDKGHDIKSIQQGLHMVRDSFHTILKDSGIEKIDTKGKLFDPNMHEAVSETANDQVEEGFIIDEIQAGYMINGRLARASKVRVSTGKDNN